MRSYLNASRPEILEQAKKLESSTLRQCHGPDSVSVLAQLGIKPKNKGKLGDLVEVLHFGLTLNSRPEPDFIAAQIELKTTGLKKLQKGGLVAKERLPLGMIDYMSFAEKANWSFETASVVTKCKTLLLMVYLYEKDTPIIDLLFKLTGIWEFPPEDLQIIRHDWEYIVDKIKCGKADDLSEADTLYLGASTAGSGHDRRRAQPFSNIKAKPRKFSIKLPYLNHIIGVLSGKRGKKFGRIIKDLSPTRDLPSLEQIVIEKFARFYGMSTDEIIANLGVELNPSSKQFAAQLTRAVMDIDLSYEIEEFSKAGIITKTVRLEPSDLPEQSISFPAFRFEELVSQKWETSDFHDQLLSKFMFAFFQFDRPKFVKGKRVANRKLILKTVKFWNMPESDIALAKKVWEKTRQLVNDGRIVESVQTDGTRLTYFPGAADNPVSHVRPHGRNRNDMYPLPIPDQLTGLTNYTKQSFWINNTYIRDAIYRS